MLEAVVAVIVSILESSTIVLLIHVTIAEPRAIVTCCFLITAFVTEIEALTIIAILAAFLGAICKARVQSCLS